MNNHRFFWIKNVQYLKSYILYIIWYFSEQTVKNTTNTTIFSPNYFSFNSLNDYSQSRAAAANQSSSSSSFTSETINMTRNYAFANAVQYFYGSSLKGVFVVNFSGNFEPRWSTLSTFPDCINNRKYLSTQEATMGSWPQKSAPCFQNNSKPYDSVHYIKFSIYFSPLWPQPAFASCTRRGHRETPGDEWGLLNRGEHKH